MARPRRTTASPLVCLVCLFISFLSFHSASKTQDEVVVASFQTLVDRVGAASNKAGDPKRLIVVDQDGGGDYKTINEAFSAVPAHNNDPITIKVNPGTYSAGWIYPMSSENYKLAAQLYVCNVKTANIASCSELINDVRTDRRERVVVPKDKRRITLQGAGRNVTKITSSFVTNETGTTYSTSTFGVSAPYFTARNISFENSSPPPPNGTTMHQAVALRTTGDFNAFYGCAFYGHQDTLYDARGRHYFKDCLVEGAVDFIFGDGKSLYKDCELRVISHRGGSITAQKRHNSSEDTGFSFVNCRVTGSSPATAYLGRAWGAYSRVVFAFTELADVVNPVGWYTWDAARESTVFYREYKCFGPGANKSRRVEWARELSDADAQPFVSLDYINGGLWVTEE